MLHDDFFWMHPDGYYYSPLQPKPERKKRKYVKSGRYAKKKNKVQDPVYTDL